jgi:hypothetical protein
VRAARFRSPRRRRTGRARGSKPRGRGIAPAHVPVMHAEPACVGRHPGVPDEDVDRVRPQRGPGIAGMDPAPEVLDVEPPSQEARVAHRDRAKRHRVVPLLGEAVSRALRAGVEGDAHRTCDALRPAGGGGRRHGGGEQTAAQDAQLLHLPPLCQQTRCHGSGTDLSPDIAVRRRAKRWPFHAREDVRELATVAISSRAGAADRKVALREATP